MIAGGVIKGNGAPGPKAALAHGRCDVQIRVPSVMIPPCGPVRQGVVGG